MPIEIYTGLPGHGKTSFMVKRLMEEAKKAHRPIWQAGIDGLQPGLASTLADPRQWNAVKPGETCTCHDTENADACEAHVIPNGSLIFIDEAWKWFGHLQDATRQATPAHVLQLAEHRHRGIDFVWTTQTPSQIYPFARGMVADHHHHVRRFGTQFVDIFTWAELNDDVKSATKREAAQRKTSALPGDAHALYKSAEVHTIKRRIPFKVMALPALVVAALVVGWLAYQKMKPDAITARLQGTESPSGEAAATSPNGPPAKVVFRTAQEYAEAFTARIPQAPWTAPGFDGRAVVSEPRVFCSVADAGQDANGEFQQQSCHCLTEQGTAYGIEHDRCMTLAVRGEVYNPYKSPERDEPERSDQSGAGVSPAAMAGTAAPGSGSGGPAAEVAHYGGMRTGESAP